MLERFRDLMFVSWDGDMWKTLVAIVFLASYYW